MHGDYLNSEGRRIRDAIFEMTSHVSMHRAIAIALENVNFGQMEAGTIERIAKEFCLPNPERLPGGTTNADSNQQPSSAAPVDRVVGQALNNEEIK